MAKPLKVGDAASVEEVDKVYEASQERHDRERLLAIRLAHQGKHTLEQIGSICFCQSKSGSPAILVISERHVSRTSFDKSSRY